MSADNPYAPSTASLRLDPHATPAAKSGPKIWRDGKVLIIAPEASLPPRCVKCNEPAEQPMKSRNVYWHHWTIYLLLLLNVVIYLIVGLATRRKARITPGLCRKHTGSRRLAIAIAWIGALASIALIVASFEQDPPILFPIGILLLLASLIFGMIRGRLLWAKRIDKEYVRLIGCAPAFLQPLPPFQG